MGTAAPQENVIGNRSPTAGIAASTATLRVVLTVALAVGCGAAASWLLLAVTVSWAYYALLLLGLNVAFCIGLFACIWFRPRRAWIAAVVVGASACVVQPLVQVSAEPVPAASVPRDARVSHGRVHWWLADGWLPVAFRIAVDPDAGFIDAYYAERLTGVTSGVLGSSQQTLASDFAQDDSAGTYRVVHDARGYWVTAGFAGGWWRVVTSRPPLLTYVWWGIVGLILGGLHVRGRRWRRTQRASDSDNDILPVDGP